MLHFEFSSVIDAPVERVFAFHERPDAIQLLTPWWLFPKVERLNDLGLQVGSELIVVTTGGFTKWHARHVGYEKNRLFADVIVSGPMREWRHEHRFEDLDQRTRLIDSINFVPKVLPGWLVLRGLAWLFQYRHAVTKRFCESSS